MKGFMFAHAFGLLILALLMVTGFHPVEVGLFGLGWVLITIVFYFFFIEKKKPMLVSWFLSIGLGVGALAATIVAHSTGFAISVWILIGTVFGSFICTTAPDLDESKEHM